MGVVNPCGFIRTEVNGKLQYVAIPEDVSKMPNRDLCDKVTVMYQGKEVTGFVRKPGITYEECRRSYNK